METIQDTQKPQHDETFLHVEALLSAAGIEYAVVDRCPEPTCAVCRTESLHLAA